MANAYGTPAYRERFCALSANPSGKHRTEELAAYRDFRAEGDIFSSENGAYRYDSMELFIYKDNKLIYHCACNEERGYRLPFFFTYKNEEYALFRRDLYGYTILNLNTLAERNYFPDKIFSGEEAFIICEAYLFRDILLLCGCFWAGPYHCYLLDLKTYRTYYLSEDMALEDIADNGLTSENDEVIISCSSDRAYRFGYKELRQKLNASNSFDL